MVVLTINASHVAPGIALQHGRPGNPSQSRLQGHPVRSWLATATPSDTALALAAAAVAQDPAAAQGLATAVAAQDLAAAQGLGPAVGGGVKRWT
ncbi:hypothetical protein CHLRE_13g574375v5 [Chlamydomonas reinhardtii]|uniref:Uncharacterized protein n=1 Tax=Chlamydomonas reinhardtii TaxID=3055 RepID=A0A2K3CZW3_CHLRE|nr:uncharacterized protein CHLRE_13g574375v5 [Chlamydomonas reinhardtii]PNW73827.1 hypothetical protein CHLRE_13g574375v5 [Chlamydomonas reinhardtii]